MTQPKFKIKKGDLVQVLVGKDKGKKGVVQKMLLDDAKLIVEGVNKVVRNHKPSSTNPGGPVEKNLPINVSNVALVDPSTGSYSKVGIREEDGKRVRYFKKSGNLV
jgi:large subunit ribosomal protein L24